MTSRNHIRAGYRQQQGTILFLPRNEYEDSSVIR